MTHETQPTTPEEHLPATPEERLLEEYLDLVERHGLSSGQAQTFRDEHKNTPGFSELAATVEGLEASRKKALWNRRVVGAVWVTAALMVAGIGWVAVQRGVALAAPFWGLNQPADLAALESSPTPSAYLEGLAGIAGEGADSWPGEVIPLAQRITEYRLGCTRLLYAEKRPLGDEAKAELNRLCLRWSEQLDNILEKLDRRAPVAEVSTEADATVKRIVTKLREQATQAEVAQTSGSVSTSVPIYPHEAAPLEGTKR